MRFRYVKWSARATLALVLGGRAFGERAVTASPTPSSASELTLRIDIAEGTFIVYDASEMGANPRDRVPHVAFWLDALTYELLYFDALLYEAGEIGEAIRRLEQDRIGGTPISDWVMINDPGAAIFGRTAKDTKTMCEWVPHDPVMLSALVGFTVYGPLGSDWEGASSEGGEAENDGEGGVALGPGGGLEPGPWFPEPSLPPSGCLLRFCLPPSPGEEPHCPDPCCPCSGMCCNGGCCSAATVSCCPGCCQRPFCCGNLCCDYPCCGNDCCPPEKCCDGVCCGSDEECCGGECCPNGYCCGGVCCESPNFCCDGLCCGPSPQQVCCDGACCPFDDCCVNAMDGTAECCPPEDCCGGECCNGPCCAGECCASSVAAGSICCGNACCQPGESCCNDVCCDGGCCKGVCCADGESCCSGEVCCKGLCCDGICCAGDENCCGGQCCGGECCDTDCCSPNEICCQGQCGVQGACCLFDGGTCTETTQLCCQNQGGLYLGDGSLCDPEDLCRPQCENCHPVSGVFYECGHEDMSEPCDPLRCIVDTLDSASCDAFPYRLGPRNCNTKETTGVEGEVTQVGYVQSIPINCSNADPHVWAQTWHGCGAACAGTTYWVRCDTGACDTTGDVYATAQKGRKAFCGCP